MTLRVLAISIMAASLFAGASSAEEEAVWLRDLDAAKKEAKRSHRDILIVNRPEQVQAAWRGYRAAARPGSEDWLDATQGLAEQLRRAGRHRAALELLDEYLKVNRAEGVLLDAAESHLALGEKEQARACLNEAEASARPLEGSRNELDVRTFAAVQRRLKGLRAQCDSKQAR
jgi:tetratricopeptide (TPR) repeat protein